MRFKHYLNEQEVLIYDTMYGNPEDVLFALEHLKPPSGEKIVILISHLGVWAKNAIKEKREEVKADPDGEQNPDGDNPEGQEEQAPDDEEKKDQTVGKEQSKVGFGGFDDDEDDADIQKREEEKKKEEKVIEPEPEPEPEEPKPPVYVPWVESDFPEREPAEE